MVFIMIREYLESTRDFFNQTLGKGLVDWKYSGVDDFVLRHGVEGTWWPLPDDVTRARAKECYQNAFQLATRYPKRFVYCEGYACNIIPVAHAWCIDRKTGAVVDPTWSDCDDATYFGVPFSWEYVMRRAVKSEVYGVFWSGAGSMINLELMRGDFDEAAVFDLAFEVHDPTKEG